MIAGVEYAAQAMAVHVGLTTDISERNASVGYLGAVRNLHVHSHTFQQFAEDLTIEANILLQQSMSFIYNFSIRAHETPLLQGRASIFIQEPESQT
jgi:predicted hotdog family 3-hydroxylacyl-ACP dehydratase